MAFAGLAEGMGRLSAGIAKDVALAAEPLHRNGTNQHSTGVDNIKPTQGGTSASYLAARLKRDFPEIAAAVERGEYASMRA